MNEPLTTAFQAQFAPLAVTVTLLVPPVELKLAVVSPSENSQGVAASSTVKFSSPMVIEPVSAVVFGLLATVYLTVPLPTPLAPPVMVMNGSLLAAVQSQSLKLGFTVTVPVPPVSLNLAFLGLNEYVQPPGS